MGNLDTCIPTQDSYVAHYLHRFLGTSAWLLPLVLLFVFFPMTLAVTVAVLIIFQVLMRTSVIYRKARRIIRDSDDIATLVGIPCRPGLFIQGNMSRRNNSTMATLTIPLNGPVRRATAFVVGHKKDGSWSLTRLQVHSSEMGVCLDLLSEAP